MRYNGMPLGSAAETKFVQHVATKLSQIATWDKICGPQSVLLAQRKVAQAQFFDRSIQFWVTVVPYTEQLRILQHWHLQI